MIGLKRAGAIGRFGCLMTVVGAFITPPLANVGAVLAVACALLQPDAAIRLRNALTQPLCRAALLLLAVFALAMLWSTAPWPERLRAFVSWRHLLLIPVALMLFNEERFKQRFALALVVAITLATLLTWGSWFANTALQPPRSPGVLMRNHSTQSMALAVGVLLALLLARHQLRPMATTWRFALMLAGAAMLSLLMLITPGRSGQLALLAMAVVVALHIGRRRWRMTALVGLPLIAAAIVAASPVVQQRFSSGLTELLHARETPELTSMGIRVVMWENTLALIGQRPLFGTGMGGFSRAYAAHASQSETGWRAMATLDPHNQLLQVAAETGLLGVLVLMLFVASAFFQRPSGPWNMAGLAVLAGWCVTSQFSSHFNAFAEGHMLMLLLGVLLARTDADDGIPSPFQLSASAAH